MDKGGWIWLSLVLGLGLTEIAVGVEPNQEEVDQTVKRYEEYDVAPKPSPKPAPKVDSDRKAWKSAEKCGTVACFHRYLKRYPKGRYAKKAQAKLENPTFLLSETAKNLLGPNPSLQPKLENPTFLLSETAKNLLGPNPSLQPKTLLAGRYQDNGDGTVTDVQTHLQWMRCSLGQTWQDGDCIGEAKTYQWRLAYDAADSLNRQGGYAGYQDWQVPTLEEMITLSYCLGGPPETRSAVTMIICQSGDYECPTIYHPAFPKTPNSAYAVSLNKIVRGSDGDLVTGNLGVIFFCTEKSKVISTRDNLFVRLVRDSRDNFR